MSARYERELVNCLTDAGFAVMRAPASGAATDRDLPDVLAGKAYDFDAGLIPENMRPRDPVSECLAIEHKYTSSTTAYVDSDEVNDLRRFASTFGAEVRLGVRFTSQSSPTDHYLLHPDDARMTDAGSFGLPLDDAEERASEVVTSGDNPEVRYC